MLAILAILQSIISLVPTLIKFLSILQKLNEVLASLPKPENTSKKESSEKPNPKEVSEQTATFSKSPENSKVSEQDEVFSRPHENTPNNQVISENTILKENRSYFLIHCKTKKFEELDESLQKLPPDTFREKFAELCPPKPALQKTENKKDVADNIKPSTESREKRKNELINKVFFIVEKFGLEKDFYSLPEEIRYLNPEEFKEYAKKNFRK